MNEWIDIRKASALTGKSINTIRKLATEHKNKSNAVKQVKGKYYISSIFLTGIYPLPDSYQSGNTKKEEVRHKKEAMQLVYNSEALKNQSDQIKTKDKQIEHLINKKSFIPLWLSIGFVIIIALIFCAGWLYRSELLNNHKAKVSYISVNHQKEVVLLKDQLTETKKSYTNLITEIKSTHSKLTDHQSKTISSKEKEIERLQGELEKISKKASTDTDI